MLSRLVPAKRLPKLSEIGSIPGFVQLPAAELEAIDQLMTVVQVRSGVRLARQDAVQHQLLLVLDGLLVVALSGRPVAALGRGAIVGEVKATGRSVTQIADVVTLTPARVAVAGAADARMLHCRCPQFWDQLCALADERLLAIPELV